MRTVSNLEQHNWNTNIDKMLILQPQIRHGIDVSAKFFPEFSTLMTETMATILKPLLDKIEDTYTWRLSKLTAGGYPIEFSFVTGDKSIKYTTEIQTPDTPAYRRLDEARELLSKLNLKSFDENGFHFLKSIQEKGIVNYGAWLGVRHSKKGSDYKIYAEVPPNGSSYANEYLTKFLRCPVFINNRTISLKMVGLCPSSGKMEFYFQVFELRPWEIISLLSPVGLELYENQIFSHFQQAYKRPMHQKLPGPVFGFSYTISPYNSDISPVFSLYTFSDTMFRNDANARYSLLRFFDEKNIDMSFYEEMSSPLINCKNSCYYHGLFGVSVGQDIGVATHIGLCPPKSEGEVENG